MAITTLDGLVLGLDSGIVAPWYKPSHATQIAGSWCSTWTGAGVPLAGATPGAAATCTDALTGTIVIPALSTNKAYIARIDMTGATINSHIWYDRLAHMGGLNGTLTTAQTANVVLTTAATNGRCQTNGSDVEWYLEWYTATGVTPVTATVAYTDQNNAARTTTVSIPSSTAAGRAIRIMPGAGYFIKSVTTVTLSATTATAGSFGVTAGKRLCGYTIPVANTGVVLDFAGTGMPEVKETSCLWLVLLCSTTSSGIMLGQVNIAIG